MKLISEAGLMKTVTKLSKCDETLVKEFIVNIPEDCDDKKSQEFHKVFVRGKCVNFSLAIINQYLVRSEKEECELEVTDENVCRTITKN